MCIRDRVTEQDVVAQYDLATGGISFVKPERLVKYRYTGKLHHYKNSVTDLCVTPNHDLILKHPKSGKVKKSKSEEGSWGRNYLYPRASSNQDEAPILNYWRLLIAIQADGCLRGTTPQGAASWGTTDFSLSKPRKIARLKALLELNKLRYTETFNESTKMTRISFNLNNAPLSVPIQCIKNFKWLDLSKLYPDEARGFLRELMQWDGSVNNWYNTNKEAVDVIQAVAVIAGVSATISLNRTAEQSSDTIMPQGSHPKTTKDLSLIHISEPTRPY